MSLKDYIVDTGATYTMLPTELVEKVGAIETPYTVDVELGNGRKIKTRIYAASIRIQGREGSSIIAAFEEVKPVIGVQTLEALGLRVNPVTGEPLWSCRFNLTYFY